MIDLFTPAQVRALDQRAIAAGTPEAVLMERAAGALARAVVAWAGHGYGLRVALLCGKGSNGADGVAAGRRLLGAGAAPVVHLVDGDPADPAGLPASQLARYRRAGGREAASVAEALRGADVVVDCLLGTGASGAPRGAAAAAVAALSACEAPIVACDLPSGVDASTGAVPGAAVQADLTVTIGAHKRGLWLWPARGRVGRLVLGDIGLDEGAEAPVARVLEHADAAALLPPPPPDGHKRTRGVVVVLAGSPGMGGAAVLVARGAMAGGAGLVTVASPVARDVAGAVPEALTAPLPCDDPDAAFEAVRSQVARADALAVGPGLGHDEPTVALVRHLVRDVEVPLVLDADGLNAFRGDGDALADHASPLLVLTPHAAELTRLVGDEGAYADRAERVPELARRWGAVLVAKGPGTMVAAPDGRVWVNATGSAALATGGTGDVLTGLATTLVAQRADAEQVAAAVHLHGLAGEAAARRRTVRPVTALDVAAGVADALHHLEEHR